ncbi:unnamed protein product [Notodromas monacha]|uniref:Ribosomal protein S14 n=1 Tax=Notodromas monacha TaxID=399045 RepID=A0A7R9GDQ4_9CRUS|nr:unnamed protein product [Notodromas monacha]CAG0918789.1 unnamed protein product [Notodromas monacha]
MGRLHWPGWKALRDVNRRKTVKEFSFDSRNLLAMRKNDVLPPGFQERIPLNASITRVSNRCVITSKCKGRSTQKRWRVSRIMFRHFADYNLMSGALRAHALLAPLKSCALLVPTRGSKMGRLHWPGWKALRDVNRRKTVKEFSFDSRNLLAMRKNDVLPPGFQERIPLNASITRVSNRCVITSKCKGRSTQKRWRVSRIMFRHFADYNLMSGALRAQWN